MLRNSVCDVGGVYTRSYLGVPLEVVDLLLATERCLHLNTHAKLDPPAPVSRC